MLSNTLEFRGSFERFGKSEGAWDPNDINIVSAFRNLLRSSDQLPEKLDNCLTLLTFVRMGGFDRAAIAKEMFLNSLKWRGDFRTDTISKEFKFEEYADVKKCYPHGYHGVDKCGRPVYIERIGMVDFHSLLQITTIERFIEYHIWEQEKTLNVRYPSCSIAVLRDIASTTRILDVHGVGMTNFSNSALHLFTEIQKIHSNYNPESLNRLFIINAGWWFNILWKALRGYLDAGTLAKIHVLGYDYLKDLLEVIDPGNLPTFLGGNCTCSDYGGCLVSDRGPWHDRAILEILEAVSYKNDPFDDGKDGGRSALGESWSFDNKIRALKAVVKEVETVMKSLRPLIEGLKK